MTLSRDGVGGLICLGVSLLLLWASRGIPVPALVPIGPAFYPRILFGVTAVLSVMLIVSDLVSQHRRRPDTGAQYRLVVLTFAIFTVYVFLLPVLGYRVATVIFVAVLQWTLHTPQTGKAWALIAIMAAGSMLVTYYVFEAYLNVLLPRGRLTGF